MNADLATALILGIVMLGFFAIATLTSPSIQTMRTLPGYVRTAALFVGGAFMVRSVTLIAGSEHLSDGAAGHITFSGLCASVSVGVFVFSLIVHLASERAPATVWRRRRFLANEVTKHPEAAGVMVVEVAKASGAATISPMGGGAEMLTETARYGRAVRRRKA